LSATRPTLSRKRRMRYTLTPAYCHRLTLRIVYSHLWLSAMQQTHTLSLFSSFFQTWSLANRSSSSLVCLCSRLCPCASIALYPGKIGGAPHRLWLKLLLYTLLFVIVEIDELQNHGINVADITKLKQAGICTIKAWLLTFSLTSVTWFTRHEDTSLGN
jgi:hypothetical protein